MQRYLENRITNGGDVESITADERAWAKEQARYFITLLNQGLDAQYVDELVDEAVWEYLYSREED